MQSPTGVVKKVIDIKIDKCWFDAIRREKAHKSVEGKKNHGEWKKIEAGMMVRFINTATGETMLREVRSVEEYRMVGNVDPIRAMLIAEGLENVLPGVSNIDEGVRLYHDLWFGDDDIIALYGVRAIRI